jgi:hypothetical protein
VRSCAPAEELPGHHQALDLVGALVDLGDLGVAHHPLDREVADVPVAAQELDRVGGDGQPASSSGTVPSLFTAGISEEAAQARATSLARVEL